MCAKLCGVRTSIPNRSLMSQATSVDPQALTGGWVLSWVLNWVLARGRWRRRVLDGRRGVR